MALDKVPDLQLFIGGLFTVRRRDVLKNHNVKHILSVLRGPLDDKIFEGYNHKIVEIDDVDDEDILQFIPECNRFIQHALDNGEGVLVHCAMGKSRSATIVCAYLMKKHQLRPDAALKLLREARPFCDPNDGFKKQLQIYYDASMTDDIENSSHYQRYIYHRELDMSKEIRSAPDAEKICFEDEQTQDKAEDLVELKCRKCRQLLANTQYLVSHTDNTASCSHYFLDPLSWMRPELEQAKLEGRLECFKCSANVGKYAWQGMRCSCGEWIVPAITLAKGRIDEAKPRSANASANAIRRPPTIPKRSGNGQNL